MYRIAGVYSIARQSLCAYNQHLKYPPYKVLKLSCLEEGEQCQAWVNGCYMWCYTPCLATRYSRSPSSADPMGNE